MTCQRFSVRYLYWFCLSMFLSLNLNCPQLSLLNHIEWQFRFMISKMSVFVQIFSSSSNNNLSKTVANHFRYIDLSFHLHLFVIHIKDHHPLLVFGLFFSGVTLSPYNRKYFPDQTQFGDTFVIGLISYVKKRSLKN